MSPTPFMGNNGEVFKLADGSVWEVKYEYEYLYEYYPKVTICPNRGVLLLGNKTLRVQKVASTPVRSDPQVAPVQSSRGDGVPVPMTRPAYVTKIESESDRILRLANGAIVEITAGSLGSLGVRKDAVLLTSGSNCRVWIEGKRTYRCSVLRSASTEPIAAALTSIVDVSRGGEFIKTLDGAIYEVSALHTLHTSLWLPVSEVVVLGDSRMLNLDQGDGIIAVVRLK